MSLEERLFTMFPVLFNECLCLRVPHSWRNIPLGGTSVSVPLLAQPNKNHKNEHSGNS